MVMQIDKADGKLRPDSSEIRHRRHDPVSPRSRSLFERSVIRAIQNMIDFTINTRKQLATGH
jgi:hypothetical protein